jgi:tRNA dimethylallyltransferase
MTGKTYTSFRLRKEKVRPFRIIKIGLQRPREELFERINSRVDVMVEKGLIEEAKGVLPYRHFNSLNTVGFKELFQYFDGTWDLNFALEKIRRNSRVYAKKQMTWFSHDKEIVWFHPEQESEIIALIESKRTIE